MLIILLKDVHVQYNIYPITCIEKVISVDFSIIRDSIIINVISINPVISLF